MRCGLLWIIRLTSCNTFIYQKISYFIGFLSLPFYVVRQADCTKYNNNDDDDDNFISIILYIEVQIGYIVDGT